MQVVPCCQLGQGPTTSVPSVFALAQALEVLPLWTKTEQTAGYSRRGAGGACLEELQDRIVHGDEGVGPLLGQHEGHPACRQTQGSAVMHGACTSSALHQAGAFAGTHRRMHACKKPQALSARTGGPCAKTGARTRPAAAVDERGRLLHQLQQLAQRRARHGGQAPACAWHTRQRSAAVSATPPSAAAAWARGPAALPL